jgi:ABC-type sugar transport system ATPase subunit
MAEHALYPHLSVYNNIGFPLKLARMPRRERDTRIREVAHMLGLTPYLDSKPGQLSGGQRQRVAMGRAIVRRLPAQPGRGRAAAEPELPSAAPAGQGSDRAG